MVTKYQDYIAVGFIFLGLIFCFGGYYFFKLTIFFCSFLALFFIGVIVGTQAASRKLQSKTTDLWIIYLSMGFAAMAGLLVAKYEKYGFFFLGAFFGMLLGFMVFEGIIQYITSSEIVFYIFTAVLGVGFGVLTLYLRKALQILITSFIGSYILVRSFSLFIGDFPNELLLIYEIQN